MNYSEFTNSNNWIGGFYELRIEFHPVGDNKRVNDALIALHTIKFFNGLWKERQDFQSNSISLPIIMDDESADQFYGTLNLTDGTTLPCLISLIRIEGESDWLDLSIPQASLELFYPYEYPLTKELNPWLTKIEDMFLRIAEIIYNHSPFELAMIGEEVSGDTNQNEITIEDLEKITCILPISLQKRLGVQGKGEELSKQLRLYN
ncbi:hypothetical protein GKZ89_18275 [Bacillus mangrovi]|uniref:Uncharacterized protein n=1 Tax=Metabacillus mangrovi TaxID=1491830 RepID=A0A7X2S830_9BACI|nr:hypothetical protein [Metabacillus mangrovi]MTH55344.1 hypothetical protein [Metabacillus mangrovi]